MPVDPKAFALFQEIVNKTNNKRLPWEPTAVQGEFVAPIGGRYSLLLRPYTRISSWNEQPEGPPSVAVKDEADRTLMILSTEITGIEMPIIESLYEVAQRQGLKVDEKVDDLMNSLRQLG